MTKKKSGDKRASKKTAEGTKSRRARPGRPPIYGSDGVNVMLTLVKRQVKYLDQLVDAIRDRTGKSISRSEIVRSIIEAVRTSEKDFGSAMSGNDITDLLLDRLNRDLPSPVPKSERIPHEELKELLDEENTNALHEAAMFLEKKSPDAARLILNVSRLVYACYEVVEDDRDKPDNPLSCNRVLKRLVPKS